MTKFKILIEEVFWKQHRVIRQPASLNLDHLIEAAYLLFSPRVVPGPYLQSPKLPQPESRAKYTDFSIWRVVGDYVNT